jgi:2'-5' RNA ligase
LRGARGRRHDEAVPTLEQRAAAAAEVHYSRLLEAGAPVDGAMVALYPPTHVAERLALSGGEPPEQLHVTLAYLGKAARLRELGRLRSVVAGCAAAMPPLTGVISGLGLFTAGEKPVTYASVDVPGLPERREALVAALRASGYPVSGEHGFTPHITLAYADRRAIDVATLPVTFRGLTLAVAGQRWNFPLRAPAAAAAG